MIAKNINQINRKILFLDIETVSTHRHFEDLSDGMQQMWIKKSRNIDIESTPDQKYNKIAGIYSEFAKVACVSIGFIHIDKEDNEPHIKIKSIYSQDETKILDELSTVLANTEIEYLCAHNGKEFDFPFLGRRYLINQIPIPTIIDVRNGQKPWEVRFIDTMQLWKFGDWKNYVSLELLCNLFDIPTPKDDIDGSEVGNVYWEDENYDRIAEYCEKDVVSTIQVYLKYCMMPTIEADKIDIVDRKML